MRRIILASTSRYRREMFDRLKIPYEAASPPFDEELARENDPHMSAETMALSFAESKARSLIAAFPDALILGGDQVPVLDTEILTKPETVERAKAQLAKLSGRTHRLLTAVTLVDATTGESESLLDVHEMTMRTLDADEIAAYVDHDQPLDCAGSYRVESLGVALFSSMRGDDWTGIVGLPLTNVVTLLLRRGVRVFR